jgi:O-antigen/teichoic acid export membrane protein
MNTKKNYLYNIVYNALGVVIPLITAPYMSRVLGTDGIGIYSYYYAIAYYFTLIGKLGLTNYGTRKIAEVKSDPELLKKTFSSIYFMQIIVAVITSVSYFLLVSFSFDKYKMIGYVFGIWIVGIIINIDWFLFGLERFKETATRNIIIKVVQLVAVFVFIHDQNDVWKYCLISSVGYAIGFLAFWDFGKQYLVFSGIKIRGILVHIKPCLILMIPVIALNIYRSMDKVMLGAMSNMSETGLYDSAEKIIYSLTLFVSSLGTVMMPRMSSLLSEGKRDQVIKGVRNSLIFIVFMTSAMCFGVLSVSKSLIPWFYGLDFVGSVALINLLAVTLILIGWGNVIRTQYIIPGKKDEIYIKSISLGAIVNLLINIWLIPKYSAVGSCIATLVAEAVVPIYQGIRLRKELQQKKYILDSMPFVVLGLIMFLVLKWIERALGTGTLTMMIQIVVGSAIYLIPSYLYINKFYPELLPKFNFRGKK